MPALKDLTGHRFGRLAAAELRRDHKGPLWLCLCDCGATVTVRTDQLKSGHTRSCGCLRHSTLQRRHPNGTNFKHGDATRSRRTSEYVSFSGMHQRCRDPNCKDFKNYGGRGIKVCARWRVYDNFIADMGRKPSAQHTLDRVDVNGDYEPSNCRWATLSEQNSNQRRWRRK